MSKQEPSIKEVKDFPVRNKQNVTIQSNQAKTVTVQQKPSNQPQNINLANSNTYQQGQHAINVQRNPQESGIFNVGSRSVIYTQPVQKKKGKDIGKIKVVNRNYQLFPPFELIINEEDVDDLQKQKLQQQNKDSTKDMSNDLNTSKFDDPNLKEKLLGDKKTKIIDGKTYVLQDKPQSKGKIQYKLCDPPVKIFDPPSYLEINNKKTKAKDYFRDINEKDGWVHALLSRDDIQDQLNERTRIFKFLICVTVYSENRQDLMGTLDGIYKNIEIFKNSAGVGYQDVAVVVVFDGCKQIDETVLEYFAYFDEQYEIPHDRRFCFRREVFLNTQRDGKNDWYPKQGCYTYQIHYRSPSEANENPDDYLQVFLAVKLQNNGKLSSHAFFFRAFCETFQPHYCALIDCGTQAEPDALYRMFLAMEGDPQIGGCCGYMGLNVESIIESSGQRTDKDLYSQYDFLTRFMLKIFCVQRAQKFEYSMSHILDKAFESFFGFIQVLPGAFSAYRWKTLAKKKKISKDGESEEDDNMLEQTYLVSVLDPEFKNKPDLYTLQVANMMLAEDRILCLEIFTRENYILKYIPDSYCNTDPVKYFIQLMKQRRRWINGSWFALDYVLKQFPKKLMKSTHSTSRKLVFIFAMFYATMSQLLTYITIAIYFIFLWMTLHATMDTYYIKAIGPECNLANFFVFVYLACCGGLIYYSSFTKRPEDRIQVFLFISTFLGIYVLFSYFVMVYVIVNLFFLGNKTSKDPNVQSIVERDMLQVKILVAINFLAYALPVLFKIKQGFTDLFMNAADYIFYSPSYFHTLLIFAFCNIDDLSWGTKGLEATQLQLGNIDEKSKKEIEEQIKKKQADAAKIEKNFKTSKISFLANWIFYNALLIFIMVIITSEINIKSYFILGMAYYVTAFLSLRAICAFLYMAKYYAFDKLRYYFHINKKKKQFQQENSKFNYYLSQYRMGVFEKQIVKIQNQKQNKEEIFKRTPQEIMYEYNVVQVCKGKKILNQNEWRRRNNSNPPVKQLCIGSNQQEIYEEIRQDQKKRLSIKPNVGKDKDSIKSSFKQTVNGKLSIQPKDNASLFDARKSLKKKE